MDLKTLLGLSPEDFTKEQKSQLLTLHGNVHGSWVRHLHDGEGDPDSVKSEHQVIVAKMKELGLDHKLMDTLDDTLLGKKEEKEEEKVSIKAGMSLKGKSDEELLALHRVVHALARDDSYEDHGFNSREELAKFHQGLIEKMTEGGIGHSNMDEFDTFTVQLEGPEPQVEEESVKTGGPSMPVEYFETHADLWRQWAKSRVGDGIYVQMDVPGIRAHISKDVRVSYVQLQGDSKNYCMRLPQMMHELKSVPVERLVLVGELVLYDREGKPTSEEEMKSYLMDKGDPLDSLVIFWVNDLLFDGSRALVNESTKSRLQILESLKERLETKHIRLCPTEELSTEEEFENASKQFSRIPGARGAVFKSSGSLYPRSGSTSGWAELRTNNRVLAQVVQVSKTPTGKYVYDLGLKSTGTVATVPMGRALPTSVKALPGETVEVQFAKLERGKDGDFTMTMPRVLENLGRSVESATIPQAERLANESHKEVGGLVECVAIIQDRLLRSWNMESKSRLVHSVWNGPEGIKELSTDGSLIRISKDVAGTSKEIAEEGKAWRVYWARKQAVKYFKLKGHADSFYHNISAKFGVGDASAPELVEVPEGIWVTYTSMRPKSFDDMLEEV